jgi:hypothetical protein
MVKFVYLSDCDDEPQRYAEKALSAGANVLINARAPRNTRYHFCPGKLIGER